MTEQLTNDVLEAIERVSKIGRTPRIANSISWTNLMRILADHRDALIRLSSGRKYRLPAPCDFSDFEATLVSCGFKIVQDGRCTFVAI